MNDFETIWYEKYMKNMVTYETLEKLVKAKKLSAMEIDEWKKEREEKFGY